MRMRDLVQQAMARYGQEVILVQDEGEVRLRAFFQPSRSKARQNMEQVRSPLGVVPNGQYVYIGPAEPQVKTGDTLRVGEAEYLVRRAEAIRDDQGILYLWGLCQEKGGEDVWHCQA